jgi:hypothetical protein
MMTVEKRKEDLDVMFGAWSGSDTLVSFHGWEMQPAGSGEWDVEMGWLWFLSTEPGYDEDPECFRDLWFAFGRLLAVGKGVDVGVGAGAGAGSDGVF